MTDKEFYYTAVDTVIRYAAEQDIVLRRMDFKEDWYHGYCSVRLIKSCNPMALKSITVEIPFAGRWEKQIKKSQERFLNYVNARVEKDCVSFHFTANELEIIALREQGDALADGAEIEKVIQRVNKLLALSDQSRNPSENEAIAASLQVQKLLAKYNLTMTDIAGERKEENCQQAVADVGKGKKWKYNLAQAVADNFACKAFFVGSERVVFFGYEADVVAARRVFVYLFKVGDKLANQWTKQRRERYGTADGVYNSFVAGFVTGVRSELEKQCVALAIVTQPKVEKDWAAFTEGFGEKNTSLQISTFDRNAYSEGIVEGKRALNAQFLED